MTTTYDVSLLAQAIYTVNKHAKTATDNKFLYLIKRLSLEKLISLRLAKKVGLHFVKNPRFSHQQSSVLISCADYYFHTLPEKEDFKKLDHLGHLDENYRNPIRRMSLSTAKLLLEEFIHVELQLAEKKQPSRKKQVPKKPFDHRISYFYGH